MIFAGVNMNVSCETNVWNDQFEQSGGQNALRVYYKIFGI